FAADGVPLGPVLQGGKPGEEGGRLGGVVVPSAGGGVIVPPAGRGGRRGRGVGAVGGRVDQHAVSLPSGGVGGLPRDGAADAVAVIPVPPARLRSDARNSGCPGFWGTNSALCG